MVVNWAKFEKFCIVRPIQGGYLNPEASVALIPFAPPSISMSAPFIGI